MPSWRTLHVDGETRHVVFSFERTSGEWKASLQALFVDVRASAEILRERVKAGISQARARGQPHGDHRPSKHAVPKLNVSSPGDSVNARSPNG